MIELKGGEFSGIITMSKGKDPDNLEQVAKFPNMILNAGLVEFGKNTNYIRYCNVGSSGAAVSANQTGLQNKLRHSDTRQDETYGANNDDPAAPYLWRRRTVRFAPSGSAYNVAEIGFGWDANNNCFNRALVLQNGLPSVISVLGDEFLDVQLEVRLYPPVTDFTGSFTPRGKDTAPRTWTARAVSHKGAAGEVGYVDIGRGWGLVGGGIDVNWRPMASPNPLIPLFNNWSVAAGKTYANNHSATVTDYPEAVCSTFFNLNTNNSNVTRTLYWIGCNCEFGIEFDPPFVKTNDSELTISFKYTWGRKE